MKKLLFALLLLVPSVAFATTLFPSGGGTGSTTLSGILFGNGTGILKTLTIGTNLTLTGSTLAAGGSGASSTLLGDSNTFSGTLNTFSNTIKVAALSGLVGGNAGTLYSVSTSSLNASISGSAASVANALTINSPLTGSSYNGSSGVSIGIQAAGAAQNGYLSSTDYSLLHAATTTFTSPLVYSNTTNAVTCSTCNTSNATVSSVATTYPVTGGTFTTTGTIALAFGTTTSNTWANTQTFTNPIVDGTLSGLIGGNNGTTYAVSTSSLNASISGSAASVANALTINNGGAGAASGSTYNGSAAVTISYNTIGAQVAGTYDAVVTATTPIIRTANNLAFVGLATTTQPNSSNVLTSNGGAGVYGTATSSLGVTGPITFSGTIGAQVGGVGGNFGCTTATTGATGCVSNTDFQTFVNKISSSSLSGSAPITYSSATGAIGTSFATSTFNAFNNQNTFTSLFATLATTTNATTTGSQYFTGITQGVPLYVDSTGKLGSAGSGTSGNCVKWGANNTLADQGAACGSGGGGSFPFSADNTFNQVVYSTSTPTLWFKSGLFASSTSYFGPATTTFNGDVKISTTSNSALSVQDSFGTAVLSVTTASTSGNPFTVASTTNTTLFTITQAGVASTTNLTDSGVSSAILLTNSSGSVSAYAGASSCSANNFFTGLSALGASSCGTASVTVNGTSIALGASGLVTAASSSLLTDVNTFSGSTVFTASTTNTKVANFANASTSLLTVFTQLYAPFFGSAIPNNIATGTIAINAFSVASSSVAFGDGTNTHNVFAVHSMGVVFASSTLTYYGAFGAAGTTTTRIAQPLHGSILRSASCVTDVGTAFIVFGNGSATTTTFQCTSGNGATTNFSANNTWQGGQSVWVGLGTSASAPNLITITANVEDTN